MRKNEKRINVTEKDEHLLLFGIIIGLLYGIVGNIFANWIWERTAVPRQLNIFQDVLGLISFIVIVSMTIFLIYQRKKWIEPK